MSFSAVHLCPLNVNAPMNNFLSLQYPGLRAYVTIAAFFASRLSIALTSVHFGMEFFESVSYLA
jgi:hypothetical protein